MNSFLSAVQNELLTGENNTAITENGGLGYKTTGKSLLDFNFAVGSMRSWSNDQITRAFAVACADDPETSTLFLFYLRDCRGGMGERRTFRVCFRYLAEEYPDLARKVFGFIPEYGRWDDLFGLLDTPIGEDVADMLRQQLKLDLKDMQNGVASISLLGKWLPSINAHASSTRREAEKVCKALGMTPKQYQKVCVALRKHLRVVECDMSANRWGMIRYEAVPSKANLNYNGAFFRHDPERRAAFLEKVKAGKAKVNASTLFPYDIVAKYIEDGYWIRPTDDHLEAAWKALPAVGSLENVLVVSDGSGSMNTTIGRTKIRAWDVSASLAIYFAEHSTGAFRNQFITFSGTPQLVSLREGMTLREKLLVCEEHSDWTNTDIYKTFRLILDAAIKNRLKQEELPSTVLLISDMEFDPRLQQERVFDTIKREFEEAGYKLPKMAYWNVMSRTCSIPMIQNDNGVVLVSGFSPSAVQMVMSADFDPYDALLSVLAKPRYQRVLEAIA